MSEVKSETELFFKFFQQHGIRIIASVFLKKSAKYAEKIMGLRTRYGKHKNAHSRPETARGSLMRGAAEPA